MGIEVPKMTMTDIRVHAGTCTTLCSNLIPGIQTLTSYQSSQLPVMRLITHCHYEVTSTKILSTLVFAFLFVFLVFLVLLVMFAFLLMC